jgi:hypothetical protein
MGFVANKSSWLRVYTEITFTGAIGAYYKAFSLRIFEIYHENVTFTGKKWNDFHCRQSGALRPEVINKGKRQTQLVVSVLCA